MTPGRAKSERISLRNSPPNASIRLSSSASEDVVPPPTTAALSAKSTMLKNSTLRFISSSLVRLQSADRDGLLRRKLHHPWSFDHAAETTSTVRRGSIGSL